MQPSKKILVGMSGGVDSSVSAALLVKQGYEVIGVYMKNWSDTKNLTGVCDWKNERRDAQRVAAQLGIPLVTLDFEKEYRNHVVDYLFHEFKTGRTPNPDVLCNKFIKFGVLLEEAKKRGIDKVATGHYAGVSHEGGAYHLMRAVDEIKDQTYFLHQLKQNQLEHIIFPLQAIKKQDVKKDARELGFANADKKESMGICFVGPVSMREFLGTRIKPRPGRVVTSVGDVVGEHDGLPFYTLGQRYGAVQRGGQEPLYVVAKDKQRNILIVGGENDPLLFKKDVFLKGVNWIPRKPALPFKCLARFCHGGHLNKVAIFGKLKGIQVVFKESQRALTPGQFLVFYNNYECLGGGVIQ